jgi:hypothetical protein
MPEETDFWRELDAHIEAKIGAAHAQTFAAPSTLHGAVAIDRYGHVVQGVSSNVYCHVARSSPMNVTTGVTTTVQWNDEISDAGNLFDAGIDNTVITLASTGLYLAVAHTTWASNSSGRRVMEIHGTGRIIGANNVPPVSAGNTGQVSAGFYTATSVGNQVWVEVFQNSGGTVALQSGQGQMDLAIIKIG